MGEPEVPNSCIRCPVGTTFMPNKGTMLVGAEEHSCQQIEEYLVHRTDDCGRTAGDLASFEAKCCETQTMISEPASELASPEPEVSELAPTKQTRPEPEVPNSCIRCPVGTTFMPNKGTMLVGAEERSCQQIEEYLMHRTDDCGRTAGDLATFEAT